MDSNDSLIDKIEEVKRKIAEFENNLNISSIDIDRITVDKNSQLINQLENYKKRINSIEEDIRPENYKKSANSTEKDAVRQSVYPVEQEPLLSSKAAGAAKPVQPEANKRDSYNDIKETMRKVEMEKQEVENINDLLDKLKKNAFEQKKVVAAQEVRPPQNKAEDKPKTVNPVSNGKTFDQTSNPYIRSSPVSKVEDYSKPSKADSNAVNITENDLHSISELISKLDELLKSNKDLADKLNELLKEEKVDDRKTSRNDELIKRLAILGSSGNLG